MVGIGGCDYCGEYCFGLGVYPPDPIGLYGWVPTSAIKRHNALVERRLDCSVSDGDEYLPTRHVGPWHDRRGTPLAECRHCSSRSKLDTGEWDTSLDHYQCIECWADAAGGMVLRRLRSRSRNRTDGAAQTGDVIQGAPGDAHLSTEPADRHRVGAAFSAYLGSDALPIRWVASPLDVVGALKAAIDRNRELDPDSIPGRIQPWSIRAHRAEVGPDGEIEEPADAPASDRTPGATIARAIASIILGASPEFEGVVAIVDDAGQFSDPDALPPTDDARLGGFMAELRAAAGPIAILADEIVASERPLVLQVDDQGRPHAEDGPAIAYPGLVVHAWHGVVVPDWVISDAASITIEAIDAEANAEVRRVLVERFGTERLIREGRATLVSEDETGRLWRRELRPSGRQRDEPVVVVEVLNATPEPDGSRRAYFLRVPPTMSTAREAVAWTFGMSGAEYRPTTET